MKTYNSIYLEARNALMNAGIENPAYESRLLLSSAAGKTPESLMASLSLYASDPVEERMQEYVSRRLTGEPVAYITGRWEFFGIPLFVNRNVLIPRMDTETLILAAKEILTGVKQDARILDLCCGSGCIACAMASEFPASRVTAVDVSEAALSVCRKNVAELGFNSRVICMKCDARSSPPMGLGRFDMILCNPPYIESEEIDTLDDSVKNFEPRLALDGGAAGLVFYKDIIKYWSCTLQDGGALIFEVGESQSSPVSEYLESAGFRKVYTRPDTLNVERAVVGIR